jgi:hypothetical protein
MSYLICGIHRDRPAVCRRYPQRDSYMPESCGYRFEAGEKRGDCYLDCQASCCMEPRQDGEPGGQPLPEVSGGMPCKHLRDVDEAPEGAMVEKPDE